MMKEPMNIYLNNHLFNFISDYLMNGTTIDSPLRTGQANGNKGTLIVHSHSRVRFDK